MSGHTTPMRGDAISIASFDSRSRALKVPLTTGLAMAEFGTPIRPTSDLYIPQTSAKNSGAYLVYSPLAVKLLLT
jgi:hypothetical protein